MLSSDSLQCPSVQQQRSLSCFQCSLTCRRTAYIQSFRLCSQRATTEQYCLSLAARRRQQRLAGPLLHRICQRRAFRTNQESLQRPSASLRHRTPLRRLRLSRLQPRKVSARAVTTVLSAGVACIPHRTGRRKFVASAALDRTGRQSTLARAVAASDGCITAPSRWLHICAHSFCRSLAN